MPPARGPEDRRASQQFAHSALVVAASSLYLSLRTFTRTGLPVLLGGDQGFFWMYGARVRHGELPYRDFFQMTLPGADLFHAAAFALFGERVSTANALVVSLGAALALAFFTVARGVLDAAAAALATALFVVLVFGQSLTTTHHSWSMLFTLLAVLSASSAETRWRLVLTGALLALSSFCTQTQGVAALGAVCAFVVWRGGRDPLSRRAAVRRALLTAAAFCATLAASMALFVHAAGLGAVASQTVTFVALHAGPGLPIWWRGLPERPTWHGLPTLAPFLVVNAMVALAFPLTLRAAWGRRDEGVSPVQSDRVFLLWLVGVALLAVLLTGLTWVRLFGVAWPGVLLVVWLLTRVQRHRRLIEGATWGCVLFFAVVLVRSTERHHTEPVSLPGGTVATDANLGGELSWLAAHLPPGGSLFAADRQSVYLALGLRDPLFLDGVVPGGQMTVERAEHAITELDRSHVALVLWGEALCESTGDEAGGIAVLRDYLHAHFQRAVVFENGDEAWQR